MSINFYRDSYDFKPSLPARPLSLHTPRRTELYASWHGKPGLSPHQETGRTVSCREGTLLVPWAALLTTPAVAHGWTRESLMQNYQSCFALRPMQSSTLASSPSKMLLVRNLCSYRQVLSSLIWRPGPNWCKEGRKKTIPSC